MAISALLVIGSFSLDELGVRAMTASEFTYEMMPDREAFRFLRREKPLMHAHRSYDDSRIVEAARKIFADFPDLSTRPLQFDSGDILLISQLLRPWDQVKDHRVTRVKKQALSRYDLSEMPLRFRFGIARYQD